MKLNSSCSEVQHILFTKTVQLCSENNSSLGGANNSLRETKQSLRGGNCKACGINVSRAHDYQDERILLLSGDITTKFQILTQLRTSQVPIFNF